jgi:class 3 adenylate cyclase
MRSLRFWSVSFLIVFLHLPLLGLGQDGGVSGAESPIVEAAAAEVSTSDAIIPEMRETVAGLDHANRRLFAKSLLFGVILGLGVYNLGLWQSLRDRTYLLFAAYSISVAFYCFNVDGYMLEFWFAGFPRLNSAISWLLLAATLVCYLAFSRHYLSMRKRLPRMDRALFFLGSAALLVPLIGFFLNRTLGYVLNSAIAVLAFVTIMTVAAVFWRQGRRTGGSYLFGNTVFCLGGVLYALPFLGVLPRLTIFEYLVQVGVILQQMVFSVGIASRVRRLQHEMAEQAVEKERFEKELVEKKKVELEQKVEERTRELRLEKEETERLLYNILPVEIAEELREHGTIRPRRFEEISILFTDFKGFTNTVSTIPAHKLVDELNQIFEAFDDIVERYGLEKIKTIGDAYMTAGGLPREHANHAVNCVHAALEMARYVAERNKRAAIKWNMRLGIHSGSVVAGVVGKRKFTYDIWGDAVNIASRMESAGEANRVNLSAYTFDLVKDYFDCEYRGKIEIKGKGEVDMYHVVAPREIPSKNEAGA